MTIKTVIKKISVMWKNISYYFINRQESKRHKESIDFWNTTWGLCPGCDKTYVGHRISCVGSALVYSENNTKLEDAIRMRKWNQAITIQEYDPLDDSITFNLVSCPNSRFMIILKTRCNYEYLIGDEYLAKISVCDEDIETLTQLVNEKWEIIK